MKITRKQLRQLIKETIGALVVQPRMRGQNNRSGYTSGLLEAESGETVRYYKDDNSTPDDDYEYKSEGGTWYTRKAGTSGRWISLDHPRYISSIKKLNIQYPELAVDLPNLRKVSRSNAAADNTGNTVLKFKVSKNPKVVIFYPGWTPSGSGRTDVIKEFETSGKSKQNLIVVIAANHYTPPKDLIASAISAAASEDTEPGSYSLGGWSAGGAGLAKAVAGNTSFEKIIYADPSPAHPRGSLVDLPGHGIAKMIYRPDNWSGKYRHIGQAQEVLAKKMGSAAKKRTDLNHKEMLSVAVKDLIG